MSVQTSASNSALHWDWEYSGSGPARDIYTKFVVGAQTLQGASEKSHQEITDVPHQFKALSRIRTFEVWLHRLKTNPSCAIPDSKSRTERI